MKIWIYLDGVQQGPFELEELFDKPVEPATPVWFEGMPQWKPAGEVAELAVLFGGKPVEHGADAADVADEQPVQTEVAESELVGEAVAESEDAVEALPRKRSRYAPGRPASRGVRLSEPCPPSYIGWSVFLTVCCCSPVSLGSLVASICVSTCYNKGNLRGARKASEWAAWLIMTAIALGFLPVMLTALLMGD